MAEHQDFGVIKMSFVIKMCFTLLTYEYDTCDQAQLLHNVIKMSFYITDISTIHVVFLQNCEL